MARINRKVTKLKRRNRRQRASKCLSHPKLDQEAITWIIPKKTEKSPDKENS